MTGPGARCIPGAGISPITRIDYGCMRAGRAMQGYPPLLPPTTGPTLLTLTLTQPHIAGITDVYPHQSGHKGRHTSLRRRVPTMGGGIPLCASCTPTMGEGGALCASWTPTMGEREAYIPQVHLPWENGRHIYHRVYLSGCEETVYTTGCTSQGVYDGVYTTGCTSQGV